MRDFTRRLLELKNKLDADGRCLDRQRPGPLPTEALQIAIDAIRTTGTSDFDIAVSKGQALLDGPSVSMAQLVNYFKVLHLVASADKRQVSCDLLHIRCCVSRSVYRMWWHWSHGRAMSFSTLRYAERRRRHLPAPARRRPRVQEARHLHRRAASKG
jgi:hypothetical protein